MKKAEQRFLLFVEYRLTLYYYNLFIVVNAMVTIVIPVVLFYHGKKKKMEGNQLQIEIKIQLLREKNNIELFAISHNSSDNGLIKLQF